MQITGSGWLRALVYDGVLGGSRLTGIGDMFRYVSPPTTSALPTRLQYSNDSHPNTPEQTTKMGASSPTFIYANYGEGLVDGTYPDTWDWNVWGQWGVAIWIAAKHIPSSNTTSPTPMQIWNSPHGRLVRGRLLTENSVPGQSALIARTFEFEGPEADDLEPNTLYWVMVFPSVSAVGSSVGNTAGMGIGALPPSRAHDRPMVNPNTGTFPHARMQAFWTNRAMTAPNFTSPTGVTVRPPATVFDMKIAAAHPDRLVPTAVTPGVAAKTGIIGVQIQIAPANTRNPDGSFQWRNMKIRTPNGLEDGWAIYGSSVPYTGALRALQYNTPPGLADGTPSQLPIITGVEDPAPHMGLAPGGYAGGIPEGDWIIRARTFDAGNPGTVATGFRPLDNVLFGWTADSYPAANTSPWSSTSSDVNAYPRVSIPTQVPPPVPLSPKNGRSVAVDMPTENRASVDFTWEYRNTSTNPAISPQSYAVVQVRRAGQWAWDSSAEGFGEIGLPGSATVAVGDIPEGHWEWRVRAIDSSSTVSEWSSVENFWVVPAPAPPYGSLPTDGLEGAKLGIGTYRAFLFHRGGENVIGEIPIKGVTKVRWRRVRDDTSDAEVTVRLGETEDNLILAWANPWEHELVLYRSNGYSTDRVWEGPITNITYTTDTVVIGARDMTAWLARRIVRQEINDIAGLNDPWRARTVVERAVELAQNALAQDDPNLLKHLTPCDPQRESSRQYRTLPAYSRTAFEEIDDMASNSGLDYTVMGRAMLFWGTKQNIGRLPEFQDADLGSTPIVSIYGMNFSNRHVVSDGQGVWGEANRLDGSGLDPRHGLVETLSSTWADDAEGQTPSEEAKARKRASFAAMAESTISNKNPSPVVVRLPESTTLNPRVAISIQYLIPGVVIPLRSHATLRHVSGLQRLDVVAVEATSAGESVKITMSPYNEPDEMPEGGA